MSQVTFASSLMCIFLHYEIKFNSKCPARQDVKLTASNDDYYFVFEDFLYQVSCFLSVQLSVCHVLTTPYKYKYTPLHQNVYLRWGCCSNCASRGHPLFLKTTSLFFFIPLDNSLNIEGFFSSLINYQTVPN